MILCYCCERRFPESVDEILGPCTCVSNYCDQCLCCVWHCECSGGVAQEEPMYTTDVERLPSGY